MTCVQLRTGVALAALVVLAACAGSTGSGNGQHPAIGVYANPAGAHSPAGQPPAERSAPSGTNGGTSSSPDPRYF